MSAPDSTTQTPAPAPLPEPPTKRRKVHDDSIDSTPQPYDTPENADADEKNGLRVSIREKTVDSRSSRSRSHSRSRSRRGRETTDYYSRSPSSSRSRSRLPRSSTGSRSSTRSRSRSRSRSDSPTQSPLGDVLDHNNAASPPSPLQPIKPQYVTRLCLAGHSKAISQVRISPDGRWIASCSADGTLRIWDAATGRHLDTLVGHMAGVSAVAWSPDSQTLASGSDDKAIRLWDRVTGRPARVKPLLGHHSYVYCLAFSPKGNILASGSYDEAVFLWDVRAGRQMRSLPAHSDPVSGIDFCCDGTLVVSCSTDGLTRIWDTSTGQCLRTLVHEDNPPITSVCFSPNGRYVLAFSMDSCLRLWDYVSGTVKKTYQGHENAKFSIGGCFGSLTPTPTPAPASTSPPASTSTPADDKNIPNGEAKEGSDSSSKGEAGASPEKDKDKGINVGGGGGAFIAAPSEDGDVVLWDVKSKQIVQRLRGAHDGVCFWVDVCGDTMVSAGQDGRIKVYRHKGPDAPPVDAGANGDADKAEGEKNADAAISKSVNGVSAGIKAMDVNGPDPDPDLAKGAEVDGARGGSSVTPLKEEDVKMED